jgi:RNA polymerase sigma-70 factor (ECF subfamily)
VLEAWLEQERRALKNGYAGLRLTGDTSWIDRSDWNDFMAYEHRVNEVFPRYRVIGLCTYCLETCSAEDVMEIARRHEFALVRGGARWERVGDAVGAAAALRIPAAPPQALPPTLGDILYAHKPAVLVTERDWVGLVRSIAAGDQHALHALYERANRPVFTLAVRITCSREAAEEVTLDVFHDVWRRASRYDPAAGTVLGWIMNQARSRAIDRIRFEQRKKRTDAAPMSACEEPAACAADPVEHAEQARMLRRALTRLSTAERQAIEAAFFEDLTHAEVAARLNQPLGTVKTRIRTGLHKLRAALAASERAL